MRKHLVFLETSGNQAYLYATNRLKESIGASQLVWLVGNDWLDDALKGRVGVEKIVATSGKALLTVPDGGTARRIVERFTGRAAREAPGMHLTGVLVPIESDGDEALHRAVSEAHREFNAVRDALSPVRFGFLPFAAVCPSTGRPAVVETERGGERERLSAEALAKRRKSEEWFERIRREFKAQRLDFSEGLDKLEKQLDDAEGRWLGLVFADGNGLGQVFMNFEKYAGGTGQSYAGALHEFSRAIDESAKAAFFRACKLIESSTAARHDRQDRTELPIVPLVLGGDDLTVMVDGRAALPFAAAYLRFFEQETAQHAIIRAIARQALGAERLSACAGVVLIKPHYPFHAAHRLAEGLLQSAKTVKRHVRDVRGRPLPCSALDFHVLLDAAATDLEQIRERRHANGVRLWGGPYVVSEATALPEGDARRWAAAYHLDALLRHVRCLEATDEEGRRRLPASQMHALRQALSGGKALADSELKLYRRFDDRGLESLLESRHPDSLFGALTIEGEPRPIYRTRFLDALSTVGFWPGSYKRVEDLLEDEGKGHERTQA